MTAEDLRKSILQQAIQGKLVPQDSNDEPAYVLLKRIREEKARLVKEKKIKKDKNESIIYRGEDNSHYEKFADGTVKCIDEEIPFEIPHTWEWARLSNVSIIQEGPGIRSFQYKPDGVQLLTVTNILEGYVDLQKSRKYISEIEYNEKYSHFQVNIGDIVCACSGGSWGKSAIYGIPDYKIILNTSTLRLRFFDDLADNGYLYMMTKTFLFKKQLSDQLSGMQPNFGYAHYSKILIPIPPLNEQKRIAKRIKEIQPLIDKYRVAQEQAEEMDKSLNGLLKKSILQYAIQGKLVSQIESEEPASILLEKIQQEKLRLVKEGKLKKKDLNNSIIFKGDDNKYFEKKGNEVVCIDDEIPFDIPDSWVWVRHNDLFNISGGSQPPKSVFEEFPKEGYIRLYQIRDYGPNPQPVYIPLSTASKISQKGDILLARYGASLGKVFIAEDGAYNVAIAKVIPQYNSEFIYRKFIYLYYCSSLYQKEIIGRARCAQAGFNKEDLGSLFFPLPPLQEQKRIVEALDNVLASIMRN